MFGDLIAWYLFLGGAGAGLAVVLAALDLLPWLRTRFSNRPTPAWANGLSRRFFARGYGVALALLALGAACLLADLGQPERFYFVLVHPTASLLTFGSYVLAATMACAAALGGVALFNLERVPDGLVRAVEAAAIVLGVATMAYTGLFLGAIDFVELWRSPLLPLLFVASSLSIGAAVSCGLALLESDMHPSPLASALARTDATVVLVEIVCAAAYLATVALAPGGGTAVTALALGQVGWLFWIGFVCLGLALPLAIEAAYARMGSAALLALIVPCVLIGGFFLRYCLVNAPLA